MTFTLDTLQDLFTQKGNQSYSGEAISQLDHALQCAALAEGAHSTPELIVACLLHDLGHLVHSLGEEAAVNGIDDHHEYRAIPLLRTLFPLAVTEPIRLHVQAKRYLCFVDPEYRSGLSPASIRSLELQGGSFSEQAAAEFIEQPHALEAVQLRRWDDQAKVVGQKTPDFDHFLPILISTQRFFWP